MSTPSTSTTAATRWTLDPNHVDVGFRVKHMMVATVKGSFEDVQAELLLDAEQPERSTVSAVIKTASIDTRNEQRDAHLRSADFLNVETFPEMTFKSTAVTRKGEDRFSVVGDLTIRDVTRPVTLDVEVEGPVPFVDGSRHLGYSASATFDREDFGLTWNMPLETGGVLVGREVRLSLEGELIEAPEA